MKKYLVVKEEYLGQVLQVVLPGMGKVKIETDKIGGDKSFYINNGLGYLFEEIEVGGIEKIEVIEEPIKVEKVDEVEDIELAEPVKKKGGRPKKSDSSEL